MHHHEVDQHVAAKKFHNNEEAHHCFLDEQFCELEIGKDCDHKTHLTKPTEHCFVCVFHFDKPYELPSNPPFFKLNVMDKGPLFCLVPELNQLRLFINNKGPPELA